MFPYDSADPIDFQSHLLNHPTLAVQKGVRGTQSAPLRDAKGEWISYLPTFLVAQEWREWAMTELQPPGSLEDPIKRVIRWERSCHIM